MFPATLKEEEERKKNNYKNSTKYIIYCTNIVYYTILYRYILLSN